MDCYPSQVISQLLLSRNIQNVIQMSIFYKYYHIMLKIYSRHQDEQRE